MSIPVGLPCPLKTFTGLDCPLCGATRATLALFRGDIVTAIDFNALYVLLLPLVAALVVVWLTRRRLPGWFGSRAFNGAALAAALAYMAVRNLPWAPFDYLGT